MLAIISPAKNLDYKTNSPTQLHTSSSFLEESSYLIEHLKQLNTEEIGKLMSISPALSNLNVERYQNWQLPFSLDNSKQAIFAFNGEVYTGLDAYSFTKKQLEKAQKTLRILSGLYGLLKPLDLMQPYRLEMGTRFQIGENKNLYQFWGDKLTNALNEILEEEKILINLASNEYFKSINKKELKGELITPTFKDVKNGEYKIIMMYAKKARGSMARYLIENDIQEISQLKNAIIDDYTYNQQLSKGNDWVFTRG